MLQTTCMRAYGPLIHSWMSCRHMHIRLDLHVATSSGCRCIVPCRLSQGNSLAQLIGQCVDEPQYPSASPAQSRLVSIKAEAVLSCSLIAQRQKDRTRQTLSTTILPPGDPSPTHTQRSTMMQPGIYGLDTLLHSPQSQTPSFPHTLNSKHQAYIHNVDNAHLHANQRRAQQGANSVWPLPLCNSLVTHNAEGCAHGTPARRSRSTLEAHACAYT